MRAAAEAAARCRRAKGGASRDAEEDSGVDYSPQRSPTWNPGESPPADSDDSRHSGSPRGGRAATVGNEPLFRVNFSGSLAF